MCGERNNPKAQVTTPARKPKTELRSYICVAFFFFFKDIKRDYASLRISLKTDRVSKH